MLKMSSSDKWCWLFVTFFSTYIIMTGSNILGLLYDHDTATITDLFKYNNNKYAIQVSYADTQLWSHLLDISKYDIDILDNVIGKEIDIWHNYRNTNIVVKQERKDSLVTIVILLGHICFNILMYSCCVDIANHKNNTRRNTEYHQMGEMSSTRININHVSSV